MAANNEWTDKDTADYSGDSSSKIAEAEHQAREDATKDGCFERGNDEKNSTPFSKSGTDDGGAGGFWKSIFG